MANKKLLIAIDGPAGVGKTSVGKALASKYNLGFLSTGIMYRCLGWKALKSGVNLQDEEAVFQIAKNIVWGFEREADSNLKVLVDGQFLGDALLNEEVARAASITSALPKARAVITDKQKSMAAEGGLVMEGRDIGTVIAPNANLKFYMIASAEARAERRVLQLKEKGQKADYAEILKSIISRDERDSSRKTAPLKPAKDAILIDTSALTLEEVINKVLELSRKNAS